MSKQDSSKHNSDNAKPRDRREIESNIHDTRDRLDQTLSVLQDRLSPQYLMNETFDYFRYGGPAEFTGNLSDSVKNNPVPFVLTAVGLSWLMLAPRSGPAVQAGYDKSSTLMSSSSESTGRGTLGAASDKTRNAARGLREGASSAGDSMRNQSRQIGSGVRNASQGARNAGAQTVHFVEDNPLAAAGIGLAIGAVLGGLFPASRIENEQLGDMRDDLVDKASDAGAEQASKLQSQAQDDAEQSRSEHAAVGGSSESTTKTGFPGSASDSDRKRDDDESSWITPSRETESESKSDWKTSARHSAVSEGRSTTGEPASPGDAPAPGARSKPGESRY